MFVFFLNGASEVFGVCSGFSSGNLVRCRGILCSEQTTEVVVKGLQLIVSPFNNDSPLIAERGSWARAGIIDVQPLSGCASLYKRTNNEFIFNSTPELWTVQQTNGIYITSIDVNETFEPHLSA